MSRVQIHLLSSTVIPSFSSSFFLLVSNFPLPLPPALNTTQPPLTSQLLAGCFTNYHYACTHLGHVHKRARQTSVAQTRGQSEFARLRRAPQRCGVTTQMCLRIHGLHSAIWPRPGKMARASGGEREGWRAMCGVSRASSCWSVHARGRVHVHQRLQEIG